MRTLFKALFVSLLGCFFLCGSAYAEAPEIPWSTDYNEAMDAAKDQNKPLLLFFTGSDWCGYCKRLGKAVLEMETFAREVKDRFIFLEVDFPMYKKVSNAVAEQNEDLRLKYKVRGFPTIILLTPQLREMGVTGYKDIPAKEYAKHLIEIEESYYRSIEAMSEEPPYEANSLNLAASRGETATEAPSLNLYVSPEINVAEGQA